MTQHEDVTKKLENLFAEGVLVDVKVGYWTASVANTGKDLGIDEAELPKMIVGLGTKRLVPKSVSDTWRKHAGHARYLVHRNSFDFPVADLAFVPIKMLAKVEEDLTATQKAFYACRDGLYERWDTITQEWIAEQPAGQRDRLRRLLPHRERVHSMFYMTWSIFSVSVPKRTKLVTTSRQKAEVQARLAAEAEVRYAREIEQRMQAFLTDVVNTMRTKTTETCAKVATAIRAGDVVTNRSLNSLRSFIDRYKSMNFVGDAEIENRLTALRNEIDGKTADNFTDATARAALTDVLDVLQKEAVAITDINAAGELGRRILVD